MEQDFYRERMAGHGVEVVVPDEDDRATVHRVIYEEDAVNLPGRWNDIIGGIEAGEQARVVPRLPAKVLLIDDRVALLPARPGGLFTDGLLVVHSGALLELLSEVFEVTWAHAIPLRVTAGGLKDESADEQLVLNLLAAGLTDDAMARTWGQRPTVQRRVREICARLGARTRFRPVCRPAGTGCCDRGGHRSGRAGPLRGLRSRGLCAGAHPARRARFLPAATAIRSAGERRHHVQGQQREERGRRSPPAPAVADNPPPGRAGHGEREDGRQGTS